MVSARYDDIDGLVASPYHQCTANIEEIVYVLYLRAVTGVLTPLALLLSGMLTPAGPHVSSNSESAAIAALLMLCERARPFASEALPLPLALTTPFALDPDLRIASLISCLAEAFL